MVRQLASEFSYRRPTAVATPTKQSDHGEVIAEVGIRETTSVNDYFKVLQKIENQSGHEVRAGYYKETGAGWKFIPKPLILDTAAFNELVSVAATEGVLVK